MRATALSALALCAVALAACGTGSFATGNAKMGGSITVAHAVPPDSLDPAIAYSPEAAQAHWLVYPGLVTYKHQAGAEGSKLIPAAAEKLPDVSADGLTYVFQLRKGLAYSDRTPARASDFQRAVQRALTLHWGGSRYFEQIEGARAYLRAKRPSAPINGISADDKTGRITIQLTTPDNEFPDVLAFPAAGFVPGKTPFKDMSRHPPPGLGSYEFDDSSIRPGRQYALVRTKRFKLPGIPPGNVDRITVKTVPSRSRQAQDVIDGSLDVMTDEAPVDLLPELRSKYKDRYRETPFNSTYFMFLDTQRPPLDDVKVRQAVNYAFDKRAAVRLFSGLLEPSCNFLPAGMAAYQKPDPCPWGDPNAAPNVEKARQLITDAGDKRKRVTVWGPDTPASRRITAYYVGVLDKIGLKAKQRIGGARRGAQTGFDGWLQDFPDPTDFFARLESSSVSDPKVEALMAEVKAGDPSKAADQAKQLDKYVTGPDQAYVLSYGEAKVPSFLSERMDFENCDIVSPVYRDDWSQFCLK